MLETNAFEKITITSSTIITFLFGKLDNAILVFVVFMLLDFITGIFKAAKNNQLNSTVARWGIFTKFLSLIPIILSTLLDNILGLDGTVRTISLLFYIASEGLSITENLVACGVHLPPKLVQMLEKVHSDNDDVNK